MPRLIDDIRSSDHIAAPWFITKHKAWLKLTDMVVKVIREGVSELPVLLIDNVSDYYYTASDQEYWDLARDFPNLAPPFPIFWCEHRMPKKIHSKERGDTDVAALVQHGRTGVLVQGLTPDQTMGEGIPEGTRWILWFELFTDWGIRGHPIDGPHGSIFLAVDVNGALLGTPHMQSYADESNTDLMRNIMTWLHPTLLAISFLHCKNVKINDNPVPKPLAKKYAARHKGVQPVTYKTLVIEPLKAVLRTQGRSGEVGLAKALHICRGHFRDYREGRGLFGKYKQLVWTPMTIRGTQKGKDTPPPREIEVKV